MSFFLPVVRPSRCAPRVARNDFAPLFSLLDDTFNEVARASRQARRPPFAPRFNVSEGSDYYSLEGELPGVEQQNLSVEFTDENTLTVKGRVEKQSQSTAASAIEESKSTETTDAQAEASETQSVRSHQPTVEDEKDWTEVGSPTTSEAAPSTTTAQAEQTTVTPSQPEQQQQQQPEQPQSRPWLSERSIGEFSRSFSFSERVDQDAVKASLKNGILSIVVPKAAKPENRRIYIE